MNEVVPLKEQRLSQCDSRGVGEAIAIVESGAVAPFAKTTERKTREAAVFAVDGNQFNRSFRDESVKIVRSLAAVSRLNDDRTLHMICDRHAPRVRLLNCLQKTMLFGFSLKDRQDRGRIDHH